MDAAAVSVIAQGTLVTCKYDYTSLHLTLAKSETKIYPAATTAFVTGLYGIWKRHPNYGILAGAAAMNSGLTAFTFFGIREFAVSPILVSFVPTQQYLRRRQKVPDTSDQGPTSWGELRSQSLLDSSLSGALAVGSLRGLKSGPRSVAPAAFTGAIVCAMLQYSFNELRVQRLKYLLRPTSAPSAPAPENNSSAFERLLSYIGLQRLSDDQYLAVLKRRREKHLERIRELEAEIAETPQTEVTGSETS